MSCCSSARDVQEKNEKTLQTWSESQRTPSLNELFGNKYLYIYIYPRHSMYGIYAYIDPTGTTPM